MRSLKRRAQSDPGEQRIPSKKPFASWQGCFLGPQPQIQQSPPPTASFADLYTVGDLLGEGGFGSVYDGTRNEDNLEVAIKFVVKDEMDRYIQLPGTSDTLPAEVALMRLVNEPPTCDQILKLVQWFEEPERYILILEKPDPCMDLLEYLNQLGGRMEEEQARPIMEQVIKATVHCCDRGVLHRDIKPQNLLLNTETMEVKLIDFGCGDLLEDKTYTEIAGTSCFFPREWVVEEKYEGRQATVWSLGVLLFTLLCGFLPFKTDMDIMAGHLFFRRGLSKSSRNLIRWCVSQDPADRPNLEEILQHDWFSNV